MFLYSQLVYGLTLCRTHKCSDLTHSEPLGDAQNLQGNKTMAIHTGVAKRMRGAKAVLRDNTKPHKG